MLDINKLSTSYQVKKLTPLDADHALQLVQSNLNFFNFCPPAPTRHSILEDMKIVPADKNLDDKYYLGYYDEDKLIAILDLITGYPAPKDAWVGFFMVDAKCQKKGIGSNIFTDLENSLDKNGIERIELAFPKGNEQSQQFLLKNKFLPMDREVPVPGYTMVIMEKVFHKDNK
ncbi:GNAT family N-acetyltransferase [Companilactobacillus huachuanensis]|uniref:GNAT family N-acetyltransferase n=1 Tax=Companilactobacillus huachuanensis TaxID=2559914 RepID=A0ABW1RHN7_9LACO|nr:GNAT family N-acetyltransferase [Companilactobacillus huachuanensis]